MKDFVEKGEMKINKDKQITILIDDINRNITEIYEEINDDLHQSTNEQVTDKKSDLHNLIEKFNRLSTKIQKLLSENGNVPDVDSLVKRYNKISTLLPIYSKELKAEIQNRELHKENKFQESKLNITLGKFKGYDYSTDIYTFQDLFQKIYSRSTPRRLLPDLLRNNHLEDSALLLVKSVDDIDEIWSRLKKAYGDPKMMLNKKLQYLQSFEQLWKFKDTEKIVNSLSKVINLMKDLSKLCKKHDIEVKLYNGDAIDKIYRIMGDHRITRWLTLICDEEIADAELWNRLILFLEKDMKVHQQKLLVYRKSEPDRHKDDKQQTKGRTAHYTGDESTNECNICGATDHIATSGPGGMKVFQYFTCKAFVEMTPLQRFMELRKKGLCFQCLLPGASISDSKHKEGKCQRDFVCQHPNHAKYPMKKHVLVCEEHKDFNENKDLLQKYKERCILKQKVDLPSFSKDIKLSFFTLHHSSQKHQYSTKEENIIKDKGIYQLQVIKIDNIQYTIFFDSGCGDFVSRRSAIDKLGNKAVLEHSGPIDLGGVGGIITQSPHGIYTVKLPLQNGKSATMTGVCLEQITSTFSQYPLDQAKSDIKKAYVQKYGNEIGLPKLPKKVGGDIDFMIGIKYLRYHPKPVFHLPSGLTIYESVFENAEGGSGVIGGPHEVFTKIEHQVHLNKTTFFSNQLQLYLNGYQVNPDLSMFGDKVCDFDIDHEPYENNLFVSKQIKLFSKAEETGDILYRCVKCRSCINCKNHDQTEAISIKEEIEQDVINNSVSVDYNSRSTIARLPFMQDPNIKLAPNKHKAMRVYKQQLKKLSDNPKDKDSVIKSDAKLQSLGHVDYVRNLSTEQQMMLKAANMQNYIPWRAVWKENSVSTPCRLVFDASQATNSGYSLNDLLAKGRNNMNKLQEILIRWSMHQVAYHTDVQKMYNSVKLRQEDWCYQRYIWQSELNPTKIPDEKIIKTLIYGVRSSGNQAEHGLRETAKLSQTQYPKVCDTICNDVYVDDCLSGEKSIDLAKQRADELEIVLSRGGFKLKGITFSGSAPSEMVSDDGITVSVAGLKWYSEKDVLSLDIGELNFSKKIRGRKAVNDASKIIPLKLTRRQCASKVAELFDLTGRIMPMVAAMKLDLHELCHRKLDWDDVIPDELRQIWINNFDTIQEMRHLRYNRAIVPTDSVNLDINTLDFGDSSSVMACSGIYARFKRKNGEYSCQLILGRSKVIQEGTSLPRGELIAALLNTHSGQVVKRAFGQYHKSHIKMSDNEIVLHWLKNENKPLKQWVRNRVIEIKRFTNTNDWYHVDSQNMIADIGTRKGCRMKDIDSSSIWINGFNWMRMDVSDMPLRSINNINLDLNDEKEAQREIPAITMHSNEITSTSKLPQDIFKRYEYSNYIIDPNKHRFSVVVRIMAIVFKFINCIRKRKFFRNSTYQHVREVNLSDEEIDSSKKYFYRKATLEVKKFNKESFYKTKSYEKDNILWYTGRILPSDDITVVGKFTDAMIDLSSTTFCVPLIDKHSPLAYSIVNEVHWHSRVKHSGVETVWREVLQFAFIIEGREIVKKFRRSCQRCRYLNKKAIEVAMGPISKYNTTIAPAFYITQVDLAGPFPAYSQHHKRTTIKVWMTIFCCTTTSTTNIKIMEDYSSASFIQAFIRFSCEVGYPKILLPDDGSQLLKSCETMKFSFKNIKDKLFIDSKVEFNVCPVGGHNMHGKVERKIREIKSSVEKGFSNERLSIIQWETAVAQVANCINDMPLALGNVVADFESMDLITPNRLRLGRNNDRSPEGVLTVSCNPDKFVKLNEKVFNTWFEIWLLVHLPKLMHQPKWFKTDYDLKAGDIVLFTKQDSSLSSKYQYGMIKSVVTDKDGKIRKANVVYRNQNENCNRETFRSVRNLIMIHCIGDLNIMKDLDDMFNMANSKFIVNS